MTTSDHVLDPHLLLDLFDEPIVIHRALLGLTGGIGPALFLSALVQMTQEQVDNTALPESEIGWHCLTQPQWTQRLSLTRYEQEAARRTLNHLGLITERRAGMPAKLSIRLNVRALSEALRAQARDRYAHLSGSLPTPVGSAN